MPKSILFLGDSFTWGEGLELYCDTPKWIKERNIFNQWNELQDKQDDDGINFRNQNRFPRLVANHFNKMDLVDDKNGGCLARNIDVAEHFLFDPDIYVDTIIIQFSCLSREPLHGTFTCGCDTCEVDRNQTSSHLTRIYDGGCVEHIVNKVLQNENMTEEELRVLSFYEKETGVSVSNSNFLNKFEEIKMIWYEKLLYQFFNKVITWQYYNKRNIYFIDSWEQQSSNSIFSQNGPFREKYIENFIPLYGKNNKKYLRFNEWENTFEKKRIISDFPRTDNMHMSLEQHQYVANSIIKFLQEKKYEWV